MTQILSISIPKPNIQSRPVQKFVQIKAQQQGWDPILARIIAGRILKHDDTLEKIMDPKLSYLASPFLLRGIEKSVDRLVEAILNQEVIGLETDHDCDGQTAHAVLYHNLVHHFKVDPNHVRSYIGHRLTEGYGLSESLAARILADQLRPTLVITADNGSSDEPRIQQLKAEGIDVIVTDHHQIPQTGLPKSAYACLNPTQPDCNYPDPAIAGCMVAWLFMSAVRVKLIEKQYLPETAPALYDTLDYVAVGTIADCVSMATSINNRAIVRYGLKLITEEVKPCWRALKGLLKQPVSSEDLGFKIGPLLNSDGRLCSALKSVSFLLAQDDEEALQWFDILEQQNHKRKQIQKTILDQAVEKASAQVALDYFGICLLLEAGHSGVQGIVASRIKDLFGRPTMIFSQKQDDPKIITGSARGIESFHVRAALQTIQDQAPDLFIAFGGHQGAAGATLQHRDFKKLSGFFEQAVRKQLRVDQLGPLLYTDGFLPDQYFSVDFVDKLAALEPFGRAFEAPIFEMRAQLVYLKPIGDGTHARVAFKKGEVRLQGVWFGLRRTPEDPIPVEVGRRLQVAFALKINTFQGRRRLEVQVAGVKL